MNNFSWDEIYDMMCGSKEELNSFLKEYEFIYTDSTQTECDFDIEELF